MKEEIKDFKSDKCLKCGRISDVVDMQDCPFHPNQEKDLKSEILKEFDEKYPQFEGVGASFPIFKNNPNRQHIKSFLSESMEKIQRAEHERIIKITEGMKKEQLDKNDPDNYG